MCDGRPRSEPLGFDKATLRDWKVDAVRPSRRARLRRRRSPRPPREAADDCATPPRSRRRLARRPTGRRSRSLALARRPHSGKKSPSCTRNRRSSCPASPPRLHTLDCRSSRSRRSSWSRFHDRCTCHLHSGCRSRPGMCGSFHRVRRCTRCLHTGKGSPSAAPGTARRRLGPHTQHGYRGSARERWARPERTFPGVGRQSVGRECPR